MEKVRPPFFDLLRRHAAMLALVALIGVPIGLGMFTFTYAKGTSYLSDDPLTCVNCHVMRDQFDAWRHSSHARVATCNDCHTPHDSPISKWLVKGINGFNHSLAFTTGDFHEPIRINAMNADVVQHNCVSCHATAMTLIAHPPGGAEERTPCQANRVSGIKVKPRHTVWRCTTCAK